MCDERRENAYHKNFMTPRVMCACDYVYTYIYIFIMHSPQVFPIKKLSQPNFWGARTHAHTARMSVT